MYKKVVVEEGQGVSEVDFDRLGSFPQTGMELLTGDHLTAGLVYAGFLTTVSDTVTVQIAAGRVYDGGRQYASEDVQERSVADYVPVTAGKSVICLVVGQGQEIADALENRFYERPIDPQNPDAGTQQTVDDGYRIRHRKAVLTVIPGIEGVRPVAPAAPIGSVAIAEILITTSGIQSVTMRVETAAIRVAAIAANQRAIQTDIALIRQAVEGLRADQAGIKAQLLGAASQRAIAALSVDMALIKDRLDVPDDGSQYWADRFLDYAETDYDPATATGHPDFDARVAEGIRFAFFGEAAFPLSLYNPNDPNLTHAASGLICPRYTAVEGIAVTAATGEMALGGVSSTAVTVERLTEKRERIRTGSSFTVCNNSQFWTSGRYDPVSGIFTSAAGETYKAAAELRNLGGGVNHQYVRLQRFWTDTIDVAYDKFTADAVTVNGVVKAESFLVHQERWSPRTWLGIKRWGAGAEITAVLCEAKDNGDPDTSRALATVTKTAADFKVWPERTYFTHAKPVFLAPIAGSHNRARAYAIAYFVTGDVDVATADGSAFLGGNLFTTTDGVAYDVDLVKDLCFGVDYCSFEITQIPVRLGAFQLSGGIEDIDILAPMIVPSAAQTVFEINIDGTWRALSAANAQADFINGVTSLYEARVVLTGTQWGMPIIETGQSRVRLTRNKDAFVWVGPGADDGTDGHTFDAPASEVKLKAVVGAFDAARHTLTAKCLSGAGFATVVTAPAPTVRAVPGREVARIDQEAAVEMEWTFDLSLAPADTVKLRLEGGTDNYRVPFHVEWAVARRTA